MCKTIFPHAIWHWSALCTGAQRFAQAHMYAFATIQFTLLVLVLCLPWNYLCQKQFCSDLWHMLHCSFICLPPQPSTDHSRLTLKSELAKNKTDREHSCQQGNAIVSYWKVSQSKNDAAGNFSKGAPVSKVIEFTNFYQKIWYFSKSCPSPLHLKIREGKGSKSFLLFY